jgi:hypothetical protein
LNLNPDIGILRKWDEEVSPYTDVAASLRYLRLLKPCKAADFALLNLFLIKMTGMSTHLLPHPVAPQRACQSPRKWINFYGIFPAFPVRATINQTFKDSLLHHWVYGNGQSA